MRIQVCSAIPRQGARVARLLEKFGDFLGPRTQSVIKDLLGRYAPPITTPGATRLPRSFGRYAPPSHPSLSQLIKTNKYSEPKLSNYNRYRPTSSTHCRQNYQTNCQQHCRIAETRQKRCRSHHRPDRLSTEAAAGLQFTAGSKTLEKKRTEKTRLPAAMYDVPAA